MTAPSSPSEPQSGGDIRPMPNPYKAAPRRSFSVQCQGCGRVSDTARIGDPHDCWVNEDGSREEGGTFQ